MAYGRYAAANIRDPAEIDVRETHSGRLAHIEQQLAPGVDDQGMTIGLPPILMMPGLRCCDYEQARFDCARPEQHFPVRATGRNRESCRNRDQVRTRFCKARKQSRKAQIVADGETERSDGGSSHDDRLAAVLVDVTLAPAFTGRKIDVEQMDLVVAGTDFAARIDQE